MNREKMLKERRCGLKYWDKAVEMVGKQTIIDNAIAIYEEFHDAWGPEWPSFHWALGHAVREIVSPNKGIPISWNVGDVLSDDEIQVIAQRCQFNNQYKPCWPHK